MILDCWQIDETGFLMHDPILSLNGYVEEHISAHLDSLMSHLPDLLESGQLRPELDRLAVYELSGLENCRAIECAFLYYASLASAYVYATGQEPTKHIPAGVAVPLVEMANIVKRPPILSYASYTLANQRKIDPAGGIVVDNIQMPYRFIHKRDAEWFTLIHVDIEARAGEGVVAISKIQDAITRDNHESVIQGLGAIHRSLSGMMTTLKRMPEHCHPSVYYHEVRPYIMSFNDIVYKGVDQYAGKPQSFAGETGAQSSVIPALIRLVGLAHEKNSMTQYLTVMQDYMPLTHRDFIRGINPSALRMYVKNVNQTLLTDAYNQTLQQILEFRKLHIRYAASYIANQSPDSVGTGGTQFMTWLQKLIDETETQFLS